MEKRLVYTGASDAGWHQVESIMRCDRLYALEAVDMLPHDAKEPLVRGTLLHLGLGQFYQRALEVAEKRDPDVWATPEEALDAFVGEHGHTSGFYGHWHKPVALAVQLYLKHWGLTITRTDWRIVAVERQLRARIADPDTGERYLYTQGADLIIEARGKKWIVDHKTAARISSATTDSYAISGQMQGYHALGLALWGEQYGGVILNYISLDHDKGATRFQRDVLPPNHKGAAAIKQTIIEARRRQKRIDEALAGGAHPADIPGVYSELVCTHRYGRCPAYDICLFKG